MKTYFKQYNTIDIKGYLDIDDEDKAVISYGEDGEIIYIDELFKLIKEGLVQIKSLSE